MIDIVTIIDSTLKPTAEYIKDLNIVYPTTAHVRRDTFSINDYIVPVQGLPIRDSAMLMLRITRDIFGDDDLNPYRTVILDEAKLSLSDSADCVLNDNIAPHISNTTDSLRLELLESAAMNINDTIIPYNAPLADGVILTLRNGG